jgi:hypothetical protein
MFILMLLLICFTKVVDGTSGQSHAEAEVIQVVMEVV